MTKFNYKRWLTENRDGQANINYKPLNEQLSADSPDFLNSECFVCQTQSAAGVLDPQDWMLVGTSVNFTFDVATPDPSGMGPGGPVSADGPYCMGTSWNNLNTVGALELEDLFTYPEPETLNTIYANTGCQVSASAFLGTGNETGGEDIGGEGCFGSASLLISDCSVGITVAGNEGEISYTYAEICNDLENAPFPTQFLTLNDTSYICDCIEELNCTDVGEETPPEDFEFGADGYWDNPTNYCDGMDYYVISTNASFCESCFNANENVPTGGTISPGDDAGWQTNIGCCCCDGYTGLSQGQIDYYATYTAEGPFNAWGGPNQCDGSTIPASTNTVDTDTVDTQPEVYDCSQFYGTGQQAQSIVCDTACPEFEQGMSGFEYVDASGTYFVQFQFSGEENWENTCTCC